MTVGQKKRLGLQLHKYKALMVTLGLPHSGVMIERFETILKIDRVEISVW